ncbi:MAG: type II 3-dehydroquinate dehydratase [Candidatus Marinimicrobia bacterium]|nr:type II 3-dehydroquinate dehydratase [Candidatus Neomarinimicrobiota bacterium]
MKILVIHGPNMPLLGKISANTKTRLTIDKINRALRKTASELNIDLKILQFYDEEHMMKTISRSRKELAGILINPGPLARTAYGIRELLEILKIPAAEIQLSEFPFSKENFDQSVLKDVVKFRYCQSGMEAYLKGLMDLANYL